MSLHFFGVFAGILSVVAFAPYIFNILNNRTQPQRASWLIWSILATIAFFSQAFEGASDSLWFTGAQVAGTILVLILSAIHGKRTYMRRADFAALGAAGIGVALWYMTETAVYALAITIVVGLIGGLLTVSKAYYAPESETLSTWLILLLASVFALISVGSGDVVLLAYPAYLFALYAMLVGAIVLGRMRQYGIARV